jgi:galactokinase
LIGDHIDYNQFSVLPMAIDLDVVAAVSTNSSSIINIANCDPKYTPESFELPQNGELVSIDQKNHTWGNYFKCGYIVAQKFIQENYPNLKMKGMNLIFDGTVPNGGGLSSSAAICVASTLAVIYGNGIEISKYDLTKITIVSEHYVGLNNGGMDQCASIYGETGKCLLIEFKPNLTAYPFKFPSLDDENDELAFLISNSLEIANKHETASIHYNLRVVEMGIASDYLAHKFNLSLPLDSNLKTTGTLRGFMDEYFEKVKHEKNWDGENVDVGMDRLQHMVELVEEMFTPEQKSNGFTADDMAKEMGLSREDFENKYLSVMEVKFNTLEVYKRAKHVYMESLNVLKCLKLLEGTKENFLEKFGAIMNDSQHSLDVLNNSSSKRLNTICEIALQNGAYGSRVTGAGWGGSLVHLTTVKKLPRLMTALTTQYYRKEFPHITNEELSTALVDTKPAAGSCIIIIE